MDTPIQNLNDADRALLDLAINHDLKLQPLISSTAPHPARHTLSSLLTWFAQPHIKSAAIFLVNSSTFIDGLAQDLSRKTLRAGLEQVFAQTLSFGSVITPTLENADRGNRACRETRLVASALKRLNSNPHQPAQRSRPPSPLTSTHHHRAPVLSLRGTDTTSSTSNLSLTTSPTEPTSTSTSTDASADTAARDQQRYLALHHDLSARFIRAHERFGISPARKLLEVVGAAPPFIPSPSLLTSKSSTQFSA